jgi:hypothetical protein
MELRLYIDQNRLISNTCIINVITNNIISDQYKNRFVIASLKQDALNKVQSYL